THGRAEIQGNNLGYHGQIDVFEGVLVAGGNSITNGTNALGTGKTIVHPEGTLVHGSVDGVARRTFLRGNIELRGGDLAAGGYPGFPLMIEGGIEVSQDATISLFDVFDGTVLSEDTTFQIDSSLVLGSNVTTTLQGNGRFEFNGEIEVGDSSTLLVPEGRLQLDGTIVARDATSHLIVSGPGTNRFRAGIVIPESTSFEFIDNGQKPEIAVRGSNNSLSGNGTLANDFHLSLQGRLQPGDGIDGIGRLTIDGSVTLAAGGKYEWQVGNDTLPSAWDSIDATGNVAFTSTAASPFRFSLSASSDSSFDPNQEYRWPLLAGNDLSGFSSDVIKIDETRIREQFAIPAEARFSMEEVENRLELVYSMSFVTGDFDQNGLLDALDIDLLSRNIMAGSEELAFDLDHNSVVDDADRLYWIENLMQTYLGDSNLDGVFDSSDLVAVFKANEYEDTVVGNSTWSTGDWNGDGEFDSSDLVAAFKENGYEQGPRTKAVPEATASWINIIVFAIIYWRRRRSQ
ncbi:hypothetical protein ACFL2H_01405, partial [Planctomycetota bacterium]